MTTTVESHRPVPDVANLDARESNRVAGWREKMRSMAIQDGPPISLIARMHLWWERTSADPEFWRELLFWGAISLVVGAVIATR